MSRFPLDIPPGLTSDDTAFSTKGAWRNADKVRFWRGKPQIIGGWQTITPLSSIIGICRTIYPWTDKSNYLNVAFGTNSKLQVFNQGLLYDITPASFIPGQVNGTGNPGYGTGAYGGGAYGAPSPTDGFAMTWSLSSYGQTLIANPRNQTIYQWTNNVGTPAQPITNAPANVTYALVTPSRQVLAFGCNQVADGVFNPLTIRGSDIESITTWTPTPQNNSFEITLEGEGGRIVGARLIGDYVYVWTDNDMFMGSLTGNTNQPYRFDRVDAHCGLAGPNAAVVLGQTAYWIAPDLQFRTSGLGAEAQVTPCPIRDDFVDNLAAVQNEKIVLSTCAQFNELRMDYPDARDGMENSRYLATNLEGHWTRGIMARSAYVDAGPAAYPIAASPTGQAYYHEIAQSADGGSLKWSIESSDQYLGNADQVYAIQGVWPDFAEQQGPAQLTLYTRMYPQAQERAKGPFVLSPGQHKKDMRATGRIVRMAFSGYSAPAGGRIGLPTFDAVVEGGR